MCNPILLVLSSLRDSHRNMKDGQNQNTWRRELSSWLDKSQKLLAESGIELPSDFIRKSAVYVAAIQEWNAFASLVSTQASASELPAHIADSLSLLPYLRDGSRPPLLVDMGSGAGFPMIPIAMTRPDLQCVGFERSQRKAAFLRKCVAQLGLSNAKILGVSATPDTLAWKVGFVTARAVDKPILLLDTLRTLIDGGAVFLCQSEVLSEGFGSGYLVENIVDGWTREGLRRGGLWLVGKG